MKCRVMRHGECQDMHLASLEAGNGSEHNKGRAREKVGSQQARFIRAGLSMRHTFLLADRQPVNSFALQSRAFLSRCAGRRPQEIAVRSDRWVDIANSECVGRAGDGD